MVGIVSSERMAFVQDPSAMSKHVISPHLLYPKHIPHVHNFDFQGCKSVQWLKSSQHAGSQMQSPNITLVAAIGKFAGELQAALPHPYLSPPSAPPQLVLGTHCGWLKQDSHVLSDCTLGICCSPYFFACRDAMCFLNTFESLFLLKMLKFRTPKSWMSGKECDLQSHLYSLWYFVAGKGM